MNDNKADVVVHLSHDATGAELPKSNNQQKPKSPVTVSRVRIAGCDHEAQLKVVVTDLDMRFVSMVWFLVKLAIAAIPASIILYGAYIVFGSILSALGAMLGFK